MLGSIGAVGEGGGVDGVEAVYAALVAAYAVDFGLGFREVEDVGFDCACSLGGGDGKGRVRLTVWDGVVISGVALVPVVRDLLVAESPLGL